MAGSSGPEIAAEPRDLRIFGEFMRETAADGTADGPGLRETLRRVRAVVVPEVDAGFFPGTVDLTASTVGVRDLILEELELLADFFGTLGGDLVTASELYRTSEDLAQAQADELGRLVQETSEFIDVQEARTAKAQEAESGQRSGIADDRSAPAPGAGENPNIGDDGRVEDADKDGDGNGVKDGIQYVDGDADIDNDGRLDTFEKEYDDRDNDGKLDTKDDAEANDLPVDETPGRRP
ncbi:hypothetical protein ABT354_16715 [Streptomyces sp. NPDC000594]|uniref:hypothetical protein n=1 Tax=Streptomyces sp. NPDC000594 TaxID=3154261 RepID=UPI00331EACE5